MQAFPLKDLKLITNMCREKAVALTKKHKNNRKDLINLNYHRSEDY